MRLGLLNERIQGRKNGFIGFPEQEIFEEKCLGEKGNHFTAVGGCNASRNLAFECQRVDYIPAVSYGSFLHPSTRSQEAESYSQVTPVAVSPVYDLIEFHRVRQNTKQIEDPAVEKNF